MTQARISNRLHHLRAISSMAVVAALVAAGCGADGKSVSAAGAVRNGSLKVGVSLSMTGDFSDSGKAARRGYELWAETVNAKGGILGRRVALKVVDDASSPNQVVSNYQNLITKDHVDLVFGPFSSLLTIPSSQVAKRFGYSFLEPAGGGPEVFAQKLDNLFFVQPAPVVRQGDVFADYVLSLGAGRPKTAAYPALDDPFAQPIADQVRKRFEAAGIRTVYAQTYPAETPDLTAVVSKMAAANPDVVVAGTQSQDAYALVKAMVQLKWNPKLLYFSNGANSPTEFPNKVGAANTTGVFSSGDWFSGSNAAGSAAFTKAYLQKFGGTPTTIDNTSAEGYAVGQLVEEVAAKTGKVDNATIIKSLHTGTWPTVVGNLSWDASGSPSGNFVLVQWIDGRLQPVFPSDRAAHQPLPVKPAWGG
jgi:branched-chain amino acid transport system substrate-binding protein